VPEIAAEQDPAGVILARDEDVRRSEQMARVDELDVESLADRSFKPWNDPQSNRIRAPATSSRCFEPVTVRAAPRNVSEAMRV
jgi:hypothetical protein